MPNDASRAAVFGRDVPDAAWRPTVDLLAESRLATFLRSTGAADLEALQAHAADDPAWFWAAAVDDIGIAWQRRPSGILDAGGGPAWARWWSGGAFNYAEAATRPRAQRDPGGLAVTWVGEPGETRTLTNEQLADAVARAAGGFRSLGVGVGDRVGVFLPMLQETVITVLALGLIGAIYTPIFSGYGAPAVAARLADSGARFLVTADGFWRRGREIDLKAIADEAVAGAPSVERVVVVGRLGSPHRAPGWRDGRDVAWDDVMTTAEPVTAAPPTDPEAPYMLIYTSGTTGRPKAAVHVHGGFPLKGAQDLAHTFDLRAGDSLFWFTDLGWMMGPWAISGALLLGARLVLYEGAPDTPGPDRLWSIVARHGVTHLGLSPTVVRSLIPHGSEPVRSHDLRSLRVLGSTGEPWDTDSWWWYFREIGGGRCPVVNYSGGTEVSGGIVGCNLLRPIKPASFNGPCPGLVADVVGPDGGSIRGEVGELVVRQPHPGQTRGFWNDPERYIATYWQRFAGTWVHGDWAIVDPDGYWFIRGRSDDTLKIAGKRVGPAEVEGAVTAHRSVVEAAAIGIPHEVKGEAIVVVCTLRRGASDGPELRDAIARRVVEDLGKPLRPEAIVVVPALPKTRSGKIMRRVVRAAYLGLDPGDVSALDDPMTLDPIRAAGGDR